MTTDIDSLRRGIGKLYVDRTVGDVSERVFQQEVAERTVDLYRAVIQRKLVDGEELVAEHHAISSHFRVTQSLLKEPEQHATSVFLTNRRLLQLKSTVFPGQPPTADKRDDTVVDEIRLENLSELRFKRQFRMGEAGVGAVMCSIAVLFYEFLAFTAPVLIGLGGLGILHAFLLPTRWVEIRTNDGSRQNDPVVIYTVRKKSARNLLRLLRQRTRRQ